MAMALQKSRQMASDAIPSSTDIVTPSQKTLG